MTTEQREEALRLAKEAGMVQTHGGHDYLPVGVDTHKLERLIALARESAAPQEPQRYLVIRARNQKDWAYVLGSEYPTEGFTTFEAAAEAGKAAAMKATPQPQAPSSDDVRDKRIAELERALSQYQDPNIQTVLDSNVAACERLFERAEKAEAAQSQAAAMAGLLEEARKRLVLPPKCIAVGVGEWRDGMMPSHTGRWPEPEPVAGMQSGYESRNLAMTMASSVPSTYQWRSRVWQDNPAYAEAIDYRDRIDAALAAWKGKA